MPSLEVPVTLRGGVVSPLGSRVPSGLPRRPLEPLTKDQAGAFVAGLKLGDELVRGGHQAGPRKGGPWNLALPRLFYRGGHFGHRWGSWATG